MKDIEISRDKKNPTWAYVWDGKKPDRFTDDYKRIIIDVCGNGCICVHADDKIRYSDNGVYDTETWSYYEIIKEPIYRPIYTLEDYIEATKDRKDLRVIEKNEIVIFNLVTGLINKDSKEIYFDGHDGKYIYKNYVWLDDRSPVGVKCS